MTKNQQPAQDQSLATSVVPANQFLLLDELMIMYAMCGYPDYPSPVETSSSSSSSSSSSPSSSSSSSSSPSLLCPGAATLCTNTDDYRSSLGYCNDNSLASGLSHISTSMQPQSHPHSQPLSQSHLRPQPVPQPLPSNGVYPAHLYRCLWSSCHIEFTEPKALLAHLSEDHVGRRQRGNLNLSCQWTGCSRVARKRDHMISHLKSHVPFWPHLCTVCGNRFKHTTGLNRHLNRHSERGEIKLPTTGDNSALSRTLA